MRTGVMASPAKFRSAVSAKKHAVAEHWYRRANKRGKRITKKDAWELASRMVWGTGSTDWLEGRKPGSMVAYWAEMKDYSTAALREEARRSAFAFAKDKYFHHGPTGGRWPGERLVWTGTGWVLPES